MTWRRYEHQRPVAENVMRSWKWANRRPRKFHEPHGQTGRPVLRQIPKRSSAQPSCAGPLGGGDENLTSAKRFEPPNVIGVQVREDDPAHGGRLDAQPR